MMGLAAAQAPKKIDVVPDSVLFGWLPQPIAGTSVVMQGFFDSFFGFYGWDYANRKVCRGYTTSQTGYIAQARDAVCAVMLQSDCEWLLFLDWDVSYAPKSVYDLLDAAKDEEGNVIRPIIAGLYVTFYGTNGALYPCWQHEVDGAEFTQFDSVKLGEIYECTSVGMGFTLIHRSVLEALHKAGDGKPGRFFSHDVLEGAQAGEDVTFCKRARNLGFKVYGHGGVLLGHTKAKMFIVDDMADPKMAFIREPPRDESQWGTPIDQSKEVPVE